MSIDQPLRINRYLPIALLYFFFNGFLLPHGLLYTALLTPVFLIWLYQFASFHYIWYFFILLIPFSILHFIQGVDAFYYAKSIALFFTVYIFSVAFFEFLNQCHTIRTIYKNIIVLNFFFIIIALFALYSVTLSQIFWFNNYITAGAATQKRLQMLTYEPSYYSLLLVPIAIYYYLKMMALELPNAKLLFVLVTLPLLLSLSFGVLLGLAFAIIITVIVGIRRFFPDRNFLLYLLIAFIVILVALVVCLEVFPDSILFLRISNVFAGKDTSFKGRTFDSFYLAWQIAKEKSIVFGCGPGQVKLIGLKYFIKFYNNTSFTVEDIGIPNAAADTFATFGVVGLVIRFSLELYFFYATRVYRNYYRLSLFIFIFIYQFTGSFLANIAEYVIWLMAFHQGIFEEFDKISIRARASHIRLKSSPI
jgi:hypothetical protein